MRILLFSDVALPDSCALATRVIVLAKLLHELKHEIELVGVAYREGQSLTGSYNGISYKMLQSKNHVGIHAYKRVNQLKNDIMAYLEKVPKYDVILLSNVYYDYADVFMTYARENKTRLIMNAVEWYDWKDVSFSGVAGLIKLIKNRVALRHIHVKMRNILAISSLLDEYYSARGCNTVTIPTIVDMKEYEKVAAQPKVYGEMLKIAYAGSPAKKDYIANALRAVALLSDDERKRVQLHFYGPKLEQLSVLGISADFLETYKDNIVCHGRIPYEQVKSRIAEADFTVLLRPNKRYANAGFPTKVGESMACGTPVIANLTSDLGKYILDGQTGIVCADETPESCADAFRRVLSLSEAQRADMRAQAYQMACTSFCYDHYLNEFARFLENCYAR